MSDSEIVCSLCCSNCKTVIITSCKGGVGKSTVTANLAFALAKRGKKVLAVDCDFSNRSLDLIFGCEDRVIFDIGDLMTGKCDIDGAVLRDERNENLFFCAAPFEAGDFYDSDKFSAALDRANEHFGFDFILIDTPGAAGDTVELVSKNADMALIVVSHQPTAARAAERTGLMLDKIGVSDQRLVVNCFDADAVLCGLRTGINELIEKTHTRLCGVIPSEYELSLSQEYGKLCAESDGKNMKKISAAFDNIAARVCGVSVPLFKKVYYGRKRKELLEK
ncbi:MAG: P-loop NTPase [Clostridia bacterium]|nr:P-loop NTPase [Clostridia bacterium]